MKRKLIESIHIGKIDKEKGIIYGAKLCGLRSGNGYSYQGYALKKAVPLYEGKAINVDHPEDRRRPHASRSYADRFGRVKNVSFQEGVGLICDIHYNPKHALAAQFEWDAEHSPENVGLSQNASGSTVHRGGKEFVESIDVVRSVDLVADPATNKSLYESKGASRMRVRRKNARQSTRRQKAAVRLLESIGAKREKKAADRQMRRLIESVIEDKLAEFTPNKRDDRKPGKKNLTESKLLRKIKQLEHRDRIRNLCEDMGMRPTEVQMKALTKMQTKKEAKELIESMRSKGTKREGTKAREKSEDKKRVSTKAFLENLHDLDLEIDEEDEDDRD